jgi:peptidoglycan hydrolase CwlO-like protein
VDENKTFKYIAFVGVFIFICAVCWYLLREPDVSNQRDRASDVRDELANTGAAQRDAESHIVNAGGRIDRSLESVDEIAGVISEAESRIADSEKQNAECASIVEDSERRIEESRAILQAVRTRTRQDGK